MISWRVEGRQSDEDSARSRTEISAAWRESGLLVAYEWEFPFEKLDANEDIAGVPWHDVYMRGRWGGGGPSEVQQLVDLIAINVWPYAKIAGAMAVAGFFAKAGADTWDLCNTGLKKGIRRLLPRSRRVEIAIVQDAVPDHDVVYEIVHDDVETLDEAIDTIVRHAQGVHRGTIARPGQNQHMRWDGKLHGLVPIAWNEDTRSWERTERDVPGGRRP